MNFTFFQHLVCYFLRPILINRLISLISADNFFHWNITPEIAYTLGL